MASWYRPAATAGCSIPIGQRPASLQRSRSLARQPANGQQEKWGARVFLLRHLEGIAVRRYAASAEGAMRGRENFYHAELDFHPRAIRRAWKILNQLSTCVAIRRDEQSFTSRMKLWCPMVSRLTPAGVPAPPERPGSSCSAGRVPLKQAGLNGYAAVVPRQPERDGVAGNDLPGRPRHLFVPAWSGQFPGDQDDRFLSVITASVRCATRRQAPGTQPRRHLVQVKARADAGTIGGWRRGSW